MVYVDWRKEGLVTPVKNQGQCGASWVFPPVGSLEGQHAKATGKLVSLSERNIIDCATTAGCCNGGLMESTYNYIIKNHGIDTEAGYPSQLSMCQCHFDPTKIGATMTGFTVIKSRDENALQQAVATVGPIATVIDASHASFQLYRHGGMNFS
jgi:cathepsin L